MKVFSDLSSCIPNSFTLVIRVLETKFPNRTWQQANFLHRFTVLLIFFCTIVYWNADFVKVDNLLAVPAKVRFSKMLVPVLHKVCGLPATLPKTHCIITCSGKWAVVPSCTRGGILIEATIYLQLIQNRYTFRSFTVLHCSHQHCVQPVASDVEVVGCL